MVGSILSRLRTRCGHHHSHSNLLGITSLNTALTPLNNHHIINSHHTPHHLSRFANNHNIRLRCSSKPCSTQACKVSVRGTQLQDAVYIQLTKTHNNSCSQHLEASNPELKDGHHSSNLPVRVTGVVGEILEHNHQPKTSSKPWSVNIQSLYCCQRIAHPHR